MTFSDALRKIQYKHNSLLCIGLDTDIAKIPKHLHKSPDPQFEFNKIVIEATHDLVCAYKLNLAFYEEHGSKGWETIYKTLEIIPQDVITIADGKRGDIGNSAEKQAQAIFKSLNFSAATVNPYMGFDAVEPFISLPQKGAFILAVTSNPGSKDFQYLKINGKPLYEQVVTKTKKWNVNNNIGLVVGATRTSEIKRVRQLVPEIPFLIPGVGAQKGDLEQSVRYGCDKNGEGALINVGRAIIFASMQKQFAKKVREETEHYKEKINKYRELSIK